MKLDIEVASPNPYVQDQAPAEYDSAEIGELLQSGIKCAKEGNRLQARQLLLRVTESAPENENAWLWLASISEYPEELLVFLQNVLNINPNNERALEWTQATELMLAKTFLQRGIQASQDNRRDFAEQCFRQTLRYDNENENAWLWLASNSDSHEEKVSHLRKVLSINSENETALASLRTVKHEMSQALLQKANHAAISGEREKARDFLAEAMMDAPELEEAWILKAYLADDPEEKIACYQKILTLNPENEGAQAGLISLQKSMQESVEKKSNAETLREVFESQSFTEFASQQEESARAEAVEIENFSEISAAAAVVETAPMEFSANVSNFPVNAHSISDPFETPTDELDASFVEEIKASGSFLQDGETEYQEFQPQEIDAEPAFPAEFQPDVQITQNDISSGEFEMFQAPEQLQENSIAIEDNAGMLMFDDSDLSDKTPAESAADFFEIQLSDPEASMETLGDEMNSQFGEFSAETCPFEPSGENAFQSDPADSSFAQFETDDSFPPVDDYSQPTENLSFESELLPAIDPLMEEPAAFESGSNSFAESPAAADSFEAEAEEVQESSFDSNKNEVLIERSEPSSIVEDHSYNPPPAAAASPAAAESFSCPFCFVMNEPHTVTCVSCGTMLSLSDIETLLAHNEASPSVLEMAIEDLEGEKITRQLTEEELTNLGIAYLNSKNLRKGLTCLQEAALLNPNNVVLGSKINFLAIRVSEIEAHESKAEGSIARSLTIMVVDDSPTVRKLISGKLEKCGHTVVSAADGREALSKINEVVPDLVLLDIMMPQMDGYQVCKLIRSNEPTKGVPVIMISGKDGFFDKVRGRMAGTSGYISKPFGPETLMRTIETYVS